MASWGGCFSKGITDVASQAYVVKAGDDGPGQAVSWLLDASGIGFGERDNFAVSRASIAGASGFFDVF